METFVRSFNSNDKVQINYGLGRCAGLFLAYSKSLESMPNMGVLADSTTSNGAKLMFFFKHQIKEELKDKPDELRRYENKLYQATFNDNSRDAVMVVYEKNEILGNTLLK